MFALRHVQAITKLIIQPQVFINQIHTASALFNISKELEHLKVVIKGQELQFPYVWLRDNCQCDKCFHYSAKSRILDWGYFDPDIKPKVVEEDEKFLRVTWPDGHISQYKRDWLKFRSFTAENQKNYSETIYKPKRATWHGNEFENVCSRHEFNKILNSHQALYDLLQKLSVYGVALIENTPDSETALDEIVAKIGFTRRTHYGVKFVVQNVPNTSNVAYLSSKLQMHVDLPYYEYCPGVNMLHCLVQTSSQGGENVLSDCNYVADYMKENHPAEYKLLVDVEVEWSDVGVENGNEFFKLYRSPTIVLDKHGEITRVNFSIPQRGSHFPGSIDTVLPWYKAHSLFLELNEKFAARFKNKAGNILVFDNIRLLHGRSAYEDSSNNIRKLIGGYVDWDEIYSRLRCLKIKLNNSDGIV